MKEAMKLSLALCVVCTAAGVLLAFANAQTAEARKAAEMRTKMEALQKVLPAFDNAPLEDTVQADDVTFYCARSQGRLVAVAGEGATDKGFGGELRVLVGLEPDGKVRSVVVTAHKETPGLGTQATERKQQKSIGDLFRGDQGDKAANGADALPPNPYLDQFGGQGAVYSDVSQAPFKVTQDGGRLDAVSGATISSRAVADAATVVATAFAENRTRIVTGK